MHPLFLLFTELLSVESLCVPVLSYKYPSTTSVLTKKYLSTGLSVLALRKCRDGWYIPNAPLLEKVRNGALRCDSARLCVCVLCFIGKGVEPHLLYHGYEAIAAGGGEVLFESYLLDEVEVGIGNLLGSMPGENLYQ